MATRQAPAAKKTAAKKSSGTALTLWEQQMADAVTKQAAAEKPVGMFKNISTRNGRLKIDDTPVPDDELLCVILASAHENQYFTGVYDPETFIPPACYAFSEVDGEEDGMAPHEEASDKQGDDNGLCANCWANQMASAPTGKGKACKNVRRVLLITPDALESAEAMQEAEVRMLKVPVMSVKGWVKYVKEDLFYMQRPTWGVVSKVKLVPDPKSQFRVVFSFEEPINFDQELYDALQKKIASVSKSLVAPYAQQEEAAPPPKRGNGRAPAPPQRREAPVKPVGRMAKAMQEASTKQAKGAAPPAKRTSKY